MEYTVHTMESHWNGFDFDLLNEWANDGNSGNGGGGRSIEEFLDDALSSRYGGNWTPSGSFLFGSHDQALAYGMRAVDASNSWGGTAYGSANATMLAYVWLKATGALPSKSGIDYHLRGGSISWTAALSNIIGSQVRGNEALFDSYMTITNLRDSDLSTMLAMGGGCGCPKPPCNTTNDPYDGHSVSIAGSLAFGGGINFGFGAVWNKQGDWRFYIFGGPSNGFDASLGITVKSITQNPNLSTPFNPNQYGGWGSSHNFGYGVIDVVPKSGDNNPNFSYRPMGNTFLESGGGVSWSIPAGYTYQNSYTIFPGDWFK